MGLYRNHTFGGTLLVSGSSIGAGMLALPITTGALGFCLSILLFFVCFVFMLLSVFYLMEATVLSKNQHSNLITICKESLGPFGEGTAWVAFLMLLYSVAAAYLSGGGSLIFDALTIWLGWNVSKALGTWLFLLVFGGMIVFGTHLIDMVNRICMIGLFLSFLSLLCFVAPHVEMSHLKGSHPRYLCAAVPVVILSFTSHIIVPSLNVYFKNNISQIKKALFFGSLISLLFYLTWEYLILGTLPLQGISSLESIRRSAHPVAALTETLSALFQTSWIALSVGFFSFFALVTSFFGVTLSLHDFLADGFKLQKTPQAKGGILIMMFAPPLLFALFFPSGFMAALGYAGIFVAILYGVLPACIVWNQRYIQKKRGPFQVFGGKSLLYCMIIGSILIICFQTAATHNWIPTV